MVRKVSIFGSTGSIGRSAIDVICNANETGAAEFSVEALAAGRDVEGLASQALKLKPKIAVIADESRKVELAALLAGSGIEVAAGEGALNEAAARPCDRVLAAIVGAAGLGSTLAAIKAGNDIAIANKESIVCGGQLMLGEARQSGARIFPVDSEHSAIFQCIGDGRSLENLTITASGGPFRNWSLEQMATATPAQAAAHPVWSMGIKNSIDSASLMNKALEFIEAAVLFDVAADHINVLVHPQSIIHGMAHFDDGSVIAQLGCPDMRTPISYALGWPDRIPTTVDRLNLAQISNLEFFEVDEERFASIRLAREAMGAGPAARVVLNCANEAAVSAFIAGECGFLDISRLVEAALERFSSGNFASSKCETLEEIAEISRYGRFLVSQWLNNAPSRAGG
ncbi:1-deoxy-D-xylulose 5-phosphate reductoisomerase [Hyphomonas neptunium ATCC 15444]|uniref:1-deoxy-D-xylulose 5-phosphate reductoisomerase n=2 Tax=Hyphomonas TaxID=85 RepID=Q0C1B5_HYPNA|nr:MULTISPECIES: 1-deoxy-D-xylulose-5-phosphate reductoisomerase [Hyphomonas]ABI77423.1 1-deoxy-D-xylulose 5-phosphate reductoisomerase [Hyphomonas neptunium ATCC 15444]KCZ95109.1 1-deoxy-D-xylulose 5-phosphate reductoisomerase [Hyphomonas hirschiana VP5]